MDVTKAHLRAQDSKTGGVLGRFSVFSISLLYFFASWTNAFGFRRWFYAPTILVCIVSVLAVVQIIKNRALLRTLDLSDALFGGFLVWTALACLVHPNSKTAGYLVAYIFTFIGMSILLRLIVIRYASYSAAFYRANEYGLLVVCLFCFAEFISRYSLGISIQEWIPRSVAATAVYCNFPRVYGFSEEPTYLCWYFNTLGLLAIYTKWSRDGQWLEKAVFCAVVVAAWIVTFSTAGFVFLPAGLGVAFLVSAFKDPQLVRNVWRQRRIWLRNGALAGALALVIVEGGLMQDHRLLLSRAFRLVGFEVTTSDIALANLTCSAASGASEFLQGMREKITLTETHGTPRIQRWREHFTLALQHPWLGWGPGYFSSHGEGSSLNLFIFVGAEQGMPAMILLALGFFVRGLRILQSRIQGGGIFLAGYIAGTAHLLTMTQHFHPALWLFIAAFYIEQTRYSASEFGGSTETADAAAIRLSLGRSI